MSKKISVYKIGDSHEPSLSSQQREELSKNGWIRTVAGRGGDSWETFWRLSDGIYLGWHEISTRTISALRVALLRINYAFRGVAAVGAVTSFWNVISAMINIVDLVVGYWNNTPVNVNYSILTELWNGLYARQIQNLSVESEWNTAYWAPTQLPLPATIMTFLQLYSGSSTLYRRIVDVMSSVQMENSGSASIFARNVVNTLRAQNTCTEDELYSAKSFAEVSYLWTLVANPLSESIVEQNNPIDNDMPVREKAEILAKRRASIVSIRLECLQKLLTDSIYTDNNEIQRVILLITGTLNADKNVAPMAFYAGELRTFDDNYRFIWGFNGVNTDGNPIIADTSSETRDTIDVSRLTVYERNYIPLVVDMVFGWRVVSVPLRAIATIWNMTCNLFTLGWFGEWSIRRLSYAKNYEGQRKYVYSDTASSISRPRYSTIRDDYEQYLLKIQDERQRMIDNGNIGNKMVLIVLSYLITAGKFVYGTSNYVVLQPILIIIYNIVLAYLVLMVALFVPIVSAFLLLFNTFVYDLDGNQGLFPPARIVVMELVIGTVTLIFVSTVRTIWYSVTGVGMIVVALVTDALYRVYNLFVVNTLNIKSGKLYAVVTAIKNPIYGQPISPNANVWYQPPQSWIGRRIHLATARYLYLTFSSMSDAPTQLGHMQSFAVDMLMSGGICPKLTWITADSKEYVRAVVAKRDAELICEFANLETQIISEMPPFSTDRIKLSGAHWSGAIGLISALSVKYEGLSGKKPDLGTLIYNVLLNISISATVENKDEPYYEYTDQENHDYTLPESHRLAHYALTEHIRLIDIRVPIRPAQIF